MMVQYFKHTANYCDTKKVEHNATYHSPKLKNITPCNIQKLKHILFQTLKTSCKTTRIQKFKIPQHLTFQNLKTYNITYSQTYKP